MPSTLDHVAQFPREMYCSDGTYLYGRSSNTRQCCRIKISDETVTDLYDFGVGINVQEGFAEPETGTIFIVARNSSGQYKLYRSADAGENFTDVLDIGDRGAGHDANVRLLDAFAPITIDGVRTIFITEYDFGSSGNHDLQILKTIDDGVTWVVVATKTDSRHCHTISVNPYNNKLYFGYGDTNAQSGIFAWDGKSALPASFTWADLDGDSNIDVAHGSQKYRVLNIVFTKNYAFSMTDTVGGAVTGIWRFGHDFSNHNRVDNQVADTSNHDGWYGVVLSNGDVVFQDAPRATSTDRFVNFYSTSDEENFTVIGRVYLRNTASVSDARWFEEVGDRVYFSSPAFAGQSDKNTVSWEIGSDFTLPSPDTFHPVYRVSGGGSDSNNGYSKLKAFATLGHAVTGNRITYGAKVILSDGDHILDATDAEWQAATFPAQADHTITIGGEGSTLTRIHADGALTLQAGDGNVTFKNLQLVSGDLTLNAGYDGVLTEHVNTDKNRWR